MLLQLTGRLLALGVADAYLRRLAPCRAVLEMLTLSTSPPIAVDANGVSTITPPVRTLRKPPCVRPGYRYWPVLAIVSIDLPAWLPLPPVTRVRM